MNSENRPEFQYESGFIRELQNMLRVIGRDKGEQSLIIPETGTYDSTTENAVRTFQGIFNLEPTGEVDNITWDSIVREYNASLKRNSNTGAIRPYPKYDGYKLTDGERSELVFITQLMLNALNVYYDLPRVAVSGIFDEPTQNSVREFQRINMLDETGIVDRITWDRLAEEYNETVNENQ